MCVHICTWYIYHVHGMAIAYPQLRVALYWLYSLAVSALKCCLWRMLCLWWLFCCPLEHPGAMSKFSDYMASLHGCSMDETQPASAMALERLGRAPPQRISGQWWWGVSKPVYDDAGYAHQDVIYTSWCPTHACASCLDNVNALVSLSQFPFPVSHHTVSWPCEFVNWINVLCCGVLC